jgi:hypothetical protein
LIQQPTPLDHNTIRTERVDLEIFGHEPGAYFDVVIFPVGNYHLILILIIAINMAAPTREQFMAGVNSTGPDGRSLPAAAARMTAAEQEAARKADEETFATSSAAICKVEREKDKLAKKEEKGEQKSLLRRLVGGIVDKIVSAFKREQEKMN